MVNQDITSCTSNFKIASNNYADYFKKKDSSLLKQALFHIEKSLNCQQTRRGAIDLKISLLSLLKEYKRGYEFIDSLNDNDFTAKYKKGMDYNYFLALEYEAKSDTANRNKLLNETVTNIQNYIRQKDISKENFPEEAYYDFYFIKKRFMNFGEINAELNFLKKEYPQEKEFFDGLGTVNEQKNEVNSSESQ